MKRKRLCRCCGSLFQVRNNLQHYCSKPQCQRYRKNLWQKQKMASDLDYRANQADTQKLWRKRNPQYMRDYRSSHPEYVLHNRELQKQHRMKNVDLSLGSPVKVVKMDAITVQLSILEGIT